MEEPTRSNPIDAVYILGSGSKADDAEILYSVRSLSQYMLDLRDVYIVGSDPGNLPGAIHIEASDKYEQKWQNAYHKTRIACETAEISDTFLLMNDDFFVLNPFVGAEYPFYAHRSGDGGPCGPVNFAIHAPIRINKSFYKQMPFRVESSACKSPRTFFANFYRAPATYTSECIVRPRKTLESCYKQIKDRDFFSISDVTMTNPVMVDFLEELYPLPSPYEN